MATKFLTNIDLNQNQIIKGRFEVVGTEPTTDNFEGRMIYQSGMGYGVVKYYDGFGWRTLINNISSTGDHAGAATISNNSDGTVTIQLNLADTDSAGLLSADFWNLLNDATSDANVSTLVKRDANGQAKFGTPTHADHAATKGYVDAARAGLDVKQSVSLASTTNIDLSASPGSVPSTFEIDGVAINATAGWADGIRRYLFKNQTDATENGIYTFAAGTWARTDAAVAPELLSGGSFVFVEEGDTQAETGWVVTSDGQLTFDVDEIIWAQFSGAGQILAGDGLSKDGNTIDVNVVADRTAITGDAVDIASTYAGQSSITTVGTITTGTWNGTDIAVADGGTGASTAADARTNLADTSTSGLTTSTPVLARISKQGCAASSGITSTTTVTHNFGTTDVIVQIYEVSTGATVFGDIVRANGNTVSVVLNGSSISANDYIIVVTG